MAASESTQRQEVESEQRAEATKPLPSSMAARCLKYRESQRNPHSCCQRHVHSTAVSHRESWCWKNAPDWESIPSLKHTWKGLKYSRLPLTLIKTFELSKRHLGLQTHDSMAQQQVNPRNCCKKLFKTSHVF